MSTGQRAGCHPIWSPDSASSTTSQFQGHQRSPTAYELVRCYVEERRLFGGTRTIPEPRTERGWQFERAVSVRAGSERSGGVPRQQVPVFVSVAGVVVGPADWTDVHARMCREMVALLLAPLPANPAAG